MAEAARILRFGVLYRRFYEPDVKLRREINYRAALPEPSQWLVFCTLAALSGIIGNASYDLIKLAIRRLLSRQPASETQTIISLNDKSIREFVHQVGDYINGLQEAPEALRALITEEEHAHIAGAVHELAEETLRRDKKRVTPQALRAISRALIEQVRAEGASCLNRAQFQRILSDLWNELPP